MSAAHTHRRSPYRVLEVLLIIAMIGAGAAVFPELPSRVPTHWTLDGTPGAWMDKGWAVAMIPALAVAFSLLFLVLPKTGPFAKPSAQLTLSWERISLLIAIFFAFAYGQQMTASLRPDMAFTCGKAMVGGIGFLFLCLGALMKDLPRNAFAGIRTPWTLKDDVVWKKTHDLGGILWIIAGLVIMLESMLWWAHPITVFASALAVAVVVPVVASFVWRKKAGKRHA